MSASRTHRPPAHRSQAPEPEARRFGSRHVNGVKRPCQHGMQAYECTKCKDKAAAANEDDPARCALPPTLSPLVSPREPLDSPGMAGPAAPPRTFLEPIDEKNFRTDISTWCPGAAAPNPMPSTLARKRSSETIPAPAPVLQAAAPTAAFSLIYADGYSSRSSSACGSHLHNLLQGGSRSSLPSAASATSTTCTRTEVQLLVSQLADAEERNAELEARNASLSRAKAYLSRANASLSRANASLSHENDRLRQGHQQLDHMTVVLDNSVLRNEAEVQRKDDTIEMLRRQVQELEGQVKELEATARASPTTSPPSDSMRERALKAQGAITVEVQQRFCGHTGMTDIGVLLKGVGTDPSIRNPATHVELLKAEPLSAVSCTSSGSSSSSSSPTAYLPGTKSVWKVRDYVQEQQQQKQQQQQQQQQKRKLKQKQQQRQKQASVATVPTYIAKVTPFHSPERIEELQQGTFTAAHAGSGRIMTVPVPWSEASKELITTTAMDRAARHCSPGAHGPFLAPLQHLVRPCSQVGGPLDVGYDLELVVLYEYCAGGDAVEVVEEAVGAVLRLGGSVKEAAAAGAEVAWGATAASLRQMQIVHKLGCVVSGETQLGTAPFQAVCCTCIGQASLLLRAA